MDEEDQLGRCLSLLGSGTTEGEEEDINTDVEIM
jgi:hypothetical protein